MPKYRDIIVSPAAEWSLKDIESFKSETIGPANAGEFVDNLLLSSLSSLSAIAEDPTRYRFNAMLSGYGIQLRERLDTDSEYRVIYDCNDQTIEILIFVSMKQDLESALYRYLVVQ